MQRANCLAWSRLYHAAHRIVYGLVNRICLCGKMDRNLPNATRTWCCLRKEEASFTLAAVERSEFPFTAKDATPWFNSHLPHPLLSSLFSLFSLTPTALVLFFPPIGLPLPGPFCSNPQHLSPDSSYPRELPRDPPLFLTFQRRILATNRCY